MNYLWGSLMALIGLFTFISTSCRYCSNGFKFFLLFWNMGLSLGELTNQYQSACHQMFVTKCLLG